MYFFIYRCKILPARASPQPQICAPAASPPRPSFLPLSEPIPVPTQRASYEKMKSFGKSEQNGEESSHVKVRNITSSRYRTNLYNTYS